MKNYLLYLLFIASPLLAQTDTTKVKSLNFKIQVVDNQISIGYGLAIGDVDGDKKSDILLADQKEIVWYKNPGDRTSAWKRYVMAANLTPQDNVCIAARDLDGDGRVEVAVGAGWNPAETTDSTQSGAVFYLIRPQDPTQKWEPVRLHHEVTTHRMRWARVGKDNYQLIVVPLHGLGNKNGEGRGVRIWGYEFPKDPRSVWKRQLVDSTMHLTHNFEIWEDGDNGSATGLIIAGKEGGNVFQWRKKKWRPFNDESASNALPLLNKGVDGIGEIRRLNGGTSIATIQPMHGNLLQVESGFYSFQKPRKLVTDKEIDVLTDLFSQGHALVCGDFLGIGSDQIVAGWRNPNAEKKVGVRLFKPKEEGNIEGYSLDDSVRMACEDLQAADLDGDGDLDLIASGRSTLNVLIYWNQLKP
ncbi:FG-GAP repeat domain-containing protein [Spirosoma endophyticum]|uniref:Repeat domain-containing protein n=1 Tax=Spirosoma endophyticum TaxID=662367 RepID=A0A1I1V9N9_9BACT|nr:VCBS repeat-containing protein [Spirosoma endophyticum]SFD79614.1 Repeat domain-containing protein [Spirosoma endophyticum]